MRKYSVERNTNETSIYAEINIDGTGIYDINTGVGFFDHMLEQLSKHSLVDICVKAKGDLHIDAHHLVEDTGYVIGECLLNALGDKQGIERYGHSYVSMDDTLTRTVIDFCGRPYFVWNVKYPRDTLASMDVEIWREFFVALSAAAKMNLHIENLYGDNNHHIIESIFKSCAKAIKFAATLDPRNDTLPSTKGKL